MSNFPKAPLPKNEHARLEALRNFDIVDTEPDKNFDELADILEVLEVEG